MRDVADFTSGLIDWAGELLPNLKIHAASARNQPDQKQDGQADVVLLKLASVESLNGPRFHASVTARLRLDYRFEVFAAEPADEQQAIADLAFALLDRDDLMDGQQVVRADNAALAVSFVIERSRELPRAKPVRKAVFDLRGNAQIRGRVVSENAMPIARATLQLHGSDRLVTTDREGGFAFAAPDGAGIRATVTAKGRVAEVELQSEQPNIITLAMEP